MQQRVPHNLRAWYRAATFRGNLPVASAPAFFSVMAYRFEVDVAFACGIPARLVVEHARLALDTACRALFEAEARRTDLFGLCFPTARPCGLEWTRSPVVKERQG